LNKDKYNTIVTSLRVSGGIRSDFPITKGLLQGLAFSPYHFTLVMDELSKSIKEGCS